MKRKRLKQVTRIIFYKNQSLAIRRKYNAGDFSTLSWQQAQQRLADQTVSKYCDVNIRNLVYPHPDKHTVEVRILPSSLEIEHFQQWVAVLHKVMFTQ